MRPRVVHVITGLNTGGAQSMLTELASRPEATGYDALVVCLTDDGPAGERLRELGVEVVDLGMARGIPSPVAVWRLARLLRRERAAAVQTWLYHGDLIGGLAGRLARVPVAWGIRHSTLDPAVDRRSTLLVARACGLVGRWVPRTIICNAASAIPIHAALGYPPGKMIVIPNGFDVAAFRSDLEARADIRRELGLAEGTPLAGMLARYHAQKDLPMFARMAAALTARNPDVHLLLAGGDMAADNAELTGLLDDAGVPRGRVHLLGRRADAGRVQAALDVACLTSRAGEAFPRVLGEAMACGVPCVATDIGDCAMIVGETGTIVAPGDAEGFAAAVDALLLEDAPARAARSSACRARVVADFEVEAVAARFGDAWQRIARGERACA